MSDIKETRTWYGSPIDCCDLCHMKIDTAFVDGRTMPSGKWAIMCASCWDKQGLPLGVGNGQLYQKVWEKV